MSEVVWLASVSRRTSADSAGRLTVMQAAEFLNDDVDAGWANSVSYGLFRNR